LTIWAESTKYGHKFRWLFYDFGESPLAFFRAGRTSI
jgi:hypothetical protein